MPNKSFFGALSLFIALSGFAIAADDTSDKSTDAKKSDPPKPVIVDDSKSKATTDEKAAKSTDKSTKPVDSKKDDPKK